MKTILIPVDFSLTSSNALQYVADLSADIAIDRILLLKTHYVSIYSHIIPSAEYGQSNAQYILEERTSIEDQLLTVGQELLKKCGTDIRIETVVSELPILRAVHDVLNDQKPNMLVLGSDANGIESQIGEYVVEIAQISTVPILIIPSASHYRKVERILVPSDFDPVSQLSVLQKLQKLQLLLNPEIVILNVDPKPKQGRDEKILLNQLEEYLGSFSYEINYSEEKNIAKGILEFARQRDDIQLIVALPGKYSFFYNLTHNNITDAITLNAHIPVLILKENYLYK